MPTNKHPPDTSPVSDTTQRTCTRTLFLVYEFRHEAADPSCLSAEDENLRHGSWFSREGHGWYGHNAHNVPNPQCRNGSASQGPAGTRTIGAIPMIHRQNFIFKKTWTSRLIELIENSIEFVEISIESIESVESIFTRKSSS